MGRTHAASTVTITQKVTQNKLVCTCCSAKEVTALRQPDSALYVILYGSFGRSLRERGLQRRMLDSISSERAQTLGSNLMCLALLYPMFAQSKVPIKTSCTTTSSIVSTLFRPNQPPSTVLENYSGHVKLVNPRDIPPPDSYESMLDMSIQARTTCRRRAPFAIG